MIAASTDLSQAQMSLQIADGAPDRFLVLRYRGTEGLCQLYRFEIELASSDPDFAFEEVVGQSAILTFNGASGARQFHGIISHFEVTGETAEQIYYRAEMVPNLWLLTHRYGSRIFQNMTAPEIIANVLERCGIESDAYRFDLRQKYLLMEYCVQYRETDFNFISRLLEEAGIWWFFEQTDEGHVFVAADSRENYSAIDGDVALAYEPPSGMNVGDEHVFRFRLGRSVRPGAVTLRDFNFKKPRLDLQAQGDDGRDIGLEVSDFPGEYGSQARGTDLAKIRTQELAASRTMGYGQSNCNRMVPGRTFEITTHPQANLNGFYLLTSVTHQGKQATHRASTGSNGRMHILDARLHQSLSAARQSEDETTRELAEGLLQIAAAFKTGDPTAHRSLTSWLYHAGQVASDPAAIAAASGGNPLQAHCIPNLLGDISLASLLDVDAPTYECRFECIPAAVTFRPARVTPWPQMRGTQTARVVGPTNEEIYTDEFGRVKVQFHWDREGNFDEHSSCWIRVSQGSAGGQYGMMFLPRVGQEVVVDFLEGDPDQPLIIGRVYNGDHMPPYALPAGRTKSCIKTHSTPGGGGTNEIRFEDLKDHEQILVHAQRELHLRAGGNCVETVGYDRHLIVHHNQCERVRQNKSVEVTLDNSERIGGKRSLEVEGDATEAINGNHSQSVKGNQYVTVDGGMVIESQTDITLKVGGNFIRIDASGITLLGNVVNINSGGSAGAGERIAAKELDKPLAADRAVPGRDVNYNGGELPLTPGDGKKTQTSWIEIELVDELGRPVPNEEYEILAPDGKSIQKGTLDSNGVAHATVQHEGVCQISFPKLDAAAWERTAAPKTKKPVKKGGKQSPFKKGIDAELESMKKGQNQPKQSKGTIGDAAQKAVEESQKQPQQQKTIADVGNEVLDNFRKMQDPQVKEQFIKEELERRKKEEGEQPSESNEQMPKFIRDEVERKKKESGE